MNALTEYDFKKFVKDIFSNVKPTKRYIMIGPDFIPEMRKGQGDKYTYDFVTNINIQCGQDALDYIEKFIKEYENSLKN